MSRTTLAVFAIVAIAAMMGVASVAPAYAAKVVIDTDEDLPIKIGQQRTCGLAILFWNETRTETFTLWDNGHFKMSVSWEKEFFASKADRTSGENLIATETSLTKEQGWFDDDGYQDGDGTHVDEVVTIQDKSRTICLNGEDNFKTHYVFILHKDGTMTEPIPV